MEIAELDDKFSNFEESALINLESYSDLSFHNKSFVSQSKNAIIQLTVQLLGV